MQQPKQPSGVPTARRWRAPVGASLVVVAYGNLATMATWLPFPGPLVPAIGHPLLVAGALVWARRGAGLTWAELGITPRGLARGALLGLGLGGLMTLLVLVPLLALRAVGWTSATIYPHPEAPTAFAQTVLRLLLLTALCEEVWFRGVLQPLWARLLDPWPSIAVNASLFAAWHLAIWAWTLERVTLTPALPFALTYPAGLLILGIAGVLFSWLRQATGHLAGPIVAHWAIDVALVALVLGGWL
jgi:membrane protease YdiL (CAAX protease family)